MAEIRRLDGEAAAGCVAELAAVLVDCVAGGASVSFVWPFGQADGERFFRGVVDGVKAGERILLGAWEEGELVGTVQVVTAMPPNQPHRGEVAKLLVKRSARGRGIARQLMEAAEAEARAAGKRLLVLDTETGGVAEELYGQWGWQRVGTIPDFALLPDGRLGATTIFWKAIN